MRDDTAPSVFGVGYRDRSRDLTRYIEDPLDEAISEVIASTAATEDEAWAALQDRLTESDCYSLFGFADRRAALALRTGVGDFATEAVQALALIATARVDYRDLTVDFPLYALRATAADVTRSLAFAIARAQPAMRDLFRSRSNTNISLHDCGFAEVRSRHGLGFMQTWWNPTPRDPNLLLSAVNLADRVDLGGRYEVTELRVSKLPWVWFDRTFDAARRGRDIPTSGCVIVSAQLQGTSRWSHGLMIWLADMPDAESARAVADLARGAADLERPRTASSHAERLLTVIGGSSIGGESPVETTASLEAIARDLAGAAWGRLLVG